jgi:ectoine hydroxylase-related dioxygenase (phytanoyl-CoA dioxygenase family)
MSKYRLTKKQVAQYQQDGLLMLEDYFPSQDMELLLRIARADQALAANAADRRDSQGRVSRLSLRYDLPESAYSAYARHQGIVEPMEQLIGGPVYHYHHKMMLKEPYVGGAWEWHQDYGYWYANFLYAEMGSCMIAVDRATRENGCLQVLKGSHKAGRLEHGRTGDQTGAEMERVKVLVERLEVVHCQMEPGTVLFFHSNLLHRSDPNESPQPRWALICCYSAVSNPPFRPEVRGQFTPLEKWDAPQVCQAVERHWRELQPRQ